MPQNRESERLFNRQANRARLELFDHPENAASGRATIRVMHTDEELEIARSARRVLELGPPREIGNADRVRDDGSRPDPFSASGVPP
jgi:hypothetical protein